MLSQYFPKAVLLLIKVILILKYSKKKKKINYGGSLKPWTWGVYLHTLHIYLWRWSVHKITEAGFKERPALSLKLKLQSHKMHQHRELGGGSLSSAVSEIKITHSLLKPAEPQFPHLQESRRNDACLTNFTTLSWGWKSKCDNVVYQIKEIVLSKNTAVFFSFFFLKITNGLEVTPWENSTIFKCP